MLAKDALVWHNGSLQKLGDVSVSLLTHSLHYGTCAFEGLRAYATKEGPAIFRLEEHIDRLLYSAKALLMEVPYSKEELMQACKSVVAVNKFKSAYVRPIAFYDGSKMGVSPLGCKVHVAVIAWEWGKYLSEQVRVKISSVKRISEATTQVDAKIGGHYVNSLFAAHEAKKLGFDEALLLDHNGNIAEGPGENIFFIKDKTLYTPVLGKILKGITRDTIITLAQDLGYEVIERSITPYELSSFDAAFFTGTAAEVTPIAEISGVLFDVSKCSELQDAYFNVVEGKVKKYAKWLSVCKN